MITGTQVKEQMNEEVGRLETPNEQYARLGVDDKSIRVELERVTNNDELIAGIVGGICMGLEFAKQRAANDPEETESRDEFLQSIAPED